jgi:hypothetical protein
MQRLAFLATLLLSCSQASTPEEKFEQHAEEAKEKLKSQTDIRPRSIKAQEGTKVIVAGYDSTYEAVVKDGKAVPLKE